MSEVVNYYVNELGCVYNIVLLSFDSSWGVDDSASMIGRKDPAA